MTNETKNWDDMSIDFCFNFKLKKELGLLFEKELKNFAEGILKLQLLENIENNKKIQKGLIDEPPESKWSGWSRDLIEILSIDDIPAQGTHPDFRHYNVYVHHWDCKYFIFFWNAFCKKYILDGEKLFLKCGESIEEEGFTFL